MPKWNPMQEKAIYTKNKNVLVSASAGSGKTTVLIARLCHLIQEEKISIDHILAMTFTEAAASEMKKRLSVALEEAIQKSDAKEEKSYLRSQLSQISSAYISTIHGFCLNIIQNYYYVIGLDKKRTMHILDESTRAQIMESCMEQTFTQYYGQEAFDSLCEMFQSRPDANDTLKEQIYALFQLAQSKSDASLFLQKCKDVHEIQSIGDLPQEIQTLFFEALHVDTICILDTLQQAIYTYDTEDQEACEEKKKLLQDALLALQNHDYQTYRSLIFKESTQLFPTPKGNDDAKRWKKEIETLESKLHALLYEEKDYLFFHNQSIQHCCTLVDVTSTFLTLYENQKEAASCMDFSDMEHFALQILQASNHLVANLYREQFKEIMVDEFQDSNDVQDTLVSLICKENNVFRVGDIKQSIYGFRHATPQIMRSLIEHRKEQDEVIYLNNNYRSKKTIVDFNNTLFHHLMNINGFSSSFQKHDHTLIGIAAQEEGNEPIQFHILDDKVLCRKEDKENKDTIKASYIANQILTLRRQKGYAFKDFVILVKANAKSEYLRAAFEEAKIPYFINMKYGFYHTRAVQDVLSFLKALDNPYDDIAMCALLLSPFYSYSDSDLAKARLEKQDQSYYDYFKTQLHTFTTLRKHSKKDKVSILLEKIYQVNHYYERFTSAQEKSNLDKLLEIITQKEQDAFFSIPAFLRLLQNTDHLQVGEAIPIGLQDDVVRVMSIHQSKGLQFPVVFLYSTSTNAILDTRGLCTLDGTLGIGMQYMDLAHRYVYPTILRIAINHKITKALLEEEMRVLYVATTRAQKEMHIVDCGQESALPPLSQSEIYKRNGFSGWIRQCFAHQVFPMLKMHYITTRWEEEQAEGKTYVSLKENKRYDKQSTSLSTLSPSEHEIFTFTPRKYNPNEVKAMERGNMLHAMVEHLPSSIWNEAQIAMTAKTLQFTLTKKDKDALMQLSKHPLFQETFHAEVHKEFPFMVQQEQTISHGYMDYVALFKEHITLIDFKSDVVEEKTELINRYQEQIHAYEKALHILYPHKTIHAYLYSFHLHQMISIG